MTIDQVVIEPVLMGQAWGLGDTGGHSSSVSITWRPGRHRRDLASYEDIVLPSREPCFHPLTRPRWTTDERQRGSYSMVSDVLVGRDWQVSTHPSSTSSGVSALFTRMVAGRRA